MTYKQVDKRTEGNIEIFLLGFSDTIVYLVWLSSVDILLLVFLLLTPDSAGHWRRSV